MKRLRGIKPADAARFWKYVKRGHKSQCWLWRGKHDDYGRFHIKLRKGEYASYIATRVAYYLGHGHDPWPLNVCHSCNTPGCCNPSHTYRGTDADNLGQMVRDGRSAKGGACGKSKLKNADIKTIRRLRKQGMSLKALGRRFKTDHKNIWFIVNRVTWAHIK